MSHAKAFTQAHNDFAGHDYDRFISDLLAIQPEGTKAHSAPEGDSRTIYTFPDNSAAHVLGANSADPEAFECEEDAETMLQYLSAALDGGEKKPEDDEDDGDLADDEDEDEDEKEDA